METCFDLFGTSSVDYYYTKSCNTKFKLKMTEKNDYYTYRNFIPRNNTYR